MIFPYEFRVGFRYLRGLHSRSISLISLVSVLGITVGIAALITVLSVFNGFEREMRARILGAVAHITITKTWGMLDGWQSVAERVREFPQVVAQAPYIFGQGMVTRGQTLNPVIVQGVLPEAERQVSDYGARMVQGSLDALRPGQFGIIVGSALAAASGLKPGDQISLVVPSQQLSAVSVVPRFTRFTIVGVFRMDMYEYDNGFALVHLDDAADVFQLPGVVSGLRVKLADLDTAPVVGSEIATALGNPYRVRDWTREHRNYFRMLQMQKSMISLILVLIIAVAMFNVVSTLVMIVNKKRSDIAILRTMGASPSSIMAVFIVNGALVGMIGTVIGTVAGVLLALNVESIVRGLEQLFGVSFVPADVYFISQLPSELRWQDVAVVSGVSILLALTSSLYPARRASAMQPAEALRYE